MAIKMVAQANMRKDRTCNASFRFEPVDCNDVCYRIYVRKEAHEKLGKPDEIKVTIEASGGSK
jgi:hypothetical protein